MNLAHAIKVNKNNEHQILSFNATFTNLLNQHSVTSYWEGFNSNYFGTPLYPGPVSISGGAAWYQQVETGYNPQAFVNGVPGVPAGCTTACTTAPIPGVVLNSHYGSPNLWQLSRNIRVGAQFTF